MSFGKIHPGYLPDYLGNLDERSVVYCLALMGHAPITPQIVLAARSELAHLLVGSDISLSELYERVHRIHRRWVVSQKYKDALRRTRTRE